MKTYTIFRCGNYEIVGETDSAKEAVRIAKANVVGNLDCAIFQGNECVGDSGGITGPGEVHGERTDCRMGGLGRD